ncbi:MAG: hypothetical protein ACYC6Y_02585, partial [Thermoguttaceae bacterium]
MNRAETWTDATAIGFARVYAYSRGGGGDTAKLTGSALGNNRNRGYPTYSTLSDLAGSFVLYASGFRQVTAVGSPSGIGDVAYLYDSAVRDVLSGDDYWGELRDAAGTTFNNRVEYFDRVYAYSTDEASVDDDVAVDATHAYSLIFSGTW